MGIVVLQIERTVSKTNLSTIINILLENKKQQCAKLKKKE